MERDEAKKKILMKVGIISLMALIFIFWVLNIKNVFQNNEKIDAGESASQWRSIKEDFDETVDKMSASLDKIQATNRLMNASSSLVTDLIQASISASSTIATSTATSTQPAAASSSPIIEANASSTVKEKNCPEYINCMPTIGEARPCQIPVGCEGITQIAY